MTRPMMAVLSLVTVLIMAASVDGPASLAVLGVAVAVLAAAALSVRGMDATALAGAALSRVAEIQAHEQRRRGSFHRQSSPGTPGRPRPRAPGHGVHPV